MFLIYINERFIMENDLRQYLSPTYYIESGHQAVIAFAADRSRGCRDDRERAVRLFYAVRDEIVYNPYCYTFEKEKFRASFVLEQGEGFCVHKAILLAAAARSQGIPCRLGFANVINHLSTKRMRELLKTDLFVFHGYNELYLDGRWVKATPAFNAALCEKFNILPLDFDGITDSIFHPFDREGKRHMEYVHNYGTFSDFPLELMQNEAITYYPHIAQYIGKYKTASDFVTNPDPELK